MLTTLTTWPNRLNAFCLLLLCTLLLVQTAAAEPAPPPPFVIHTEPDNSRITIYSEFLHDEKGALTIEDISALPGSDFQPATRFIERLGVQSGHWWIRVALKNELDQPQEYTLHVLGSPHATLYQPDQTGYTLAEADQRIPGRGAGIRILLPTGQTELFYLRLQAQGYLTYGLSLTTPNQYLADQQLSNAVYMILTGALLILVIYNLIAGMMGGGITYYYHAAFLLSIIVISLLLADFLPLIVPDSALLQPRLLFVLMLVALWAAAGVTTKFMRLKQHHPRLATLVSALQTLSLIAAVSNLFLPLGIAAYLSFVLVALAAVTLIVLGYTSWHSEAQGGGMFFMTAMLVSLPALLVCLAYLGILQTSAELPQWLMGTAAIEAITLGIGLRIRRIHQNRLQTQSERSEAIANTVDSTRRETLSRIGHDVRTPLSGILGMAEILGDTPLTPNQRECVSAIQHAGDSLLRIINDVLEHSQLSAEGADINRASLDIHDQVMEAIDLFKERAEEKQIELITHVHTNVPARVLGDAGRLRQILTNLIGALIRHGSPGELVVDVSMEPTGQADRIRFGFSGSALSDDTVQRLKDSQRQSESSHLSLVIAEQLVDALEGRMGTLQDHRGAHFWFVLPLPADSSGLHPTVKVDPARLEGRSILVVDDSSTVTRVLRHHALSWGMKVTACHDPREALASLRTQANINEPYDVVVLDHQMPGMDGMQLAARIHEDPLIIHPTVLVMLTGVNQAPSATQARNVGIHRVLSKPVSAPRLRQVLAEELGNERPASHEQTEHQPDPGLRILVAEDHYLSQKVIRGMLGKLGLKADIASNGREALEKARDTRYDLVLMDCEMPEMDGFEATRKIREWEQGSGLPATPIVALTAHILKEHRDRSFAAGMNAHLPKPVELNTLRETVVRYTQPGEDTADS